MIFKDNRRKASNVTVDPKAQLRFAQPFAILLVASLATINLIFWQVFSSKGSMASSAPPEALAFLNNAMAQAVLYSSIGMLVIGILTLMLWLVYSHRIFGPMVPIRRQVEALKSGNYDFKINLRKNDEFKELANELNQLADLLKARR